MIKDFISSYHNPSSLYVNPTDKWLWLRIHKTAGTSIYDGHLIGKCFNHPKNGTELIEFWRDNITELELKEYVIWSCVRNPYDRFSSMAGMFKHDPNDFAQNFNELIKDSKIERHCLPQHKFTHYKGTQMANVIIRYENIQSQYKWICRIIEQPEIELPILNKSNHEKWYKVFTRDTIDFVNKMYKLDFKYFNYQMV